MVDAVHVHLDPQEPPNLPLGTLAGRSFTYHEFQASWQADTPPTMRSATLAGRHLAVERLWPGSTSPRAHLLRL